MPYDGNGNFVRAHNWAADAANSLDINATEMDQEDNGIAAALSNAVTRDGQGKMAVDFLPNADLTLNLGSAILRWASLNGTAIPTGNNPWTITPQTAAEATALVTPTQLGYSPGPMIDPRRYGADPTGVADSTTAIQNAIKVATQKGGLIFLGPGTYKITSTITLRPNVTIWGAGCGDSSTVGAAARATILQPAVGFTGTDIVRADPADFGTDIYCRGVSVSNLMIDMNNVTSTASLVALRLKSISDNPTFENLRIWNMGANHVAVQVGVSANGGAIQTDGTIFSNLVTLTAAIDTYTASMVILEDCNEMAIRDCKILSRSNGAPISTSIGIQIKGTNIGCQGITIDGTSLGGFNAGIETTGTGGGVGARWVRVLNGTFETNKYGVVLTGILALQAQFCTLGPGNRFISNVAGGANYFLDFASNCTVIADEFALTTNVQLTANATGNTIWAQLAGVVDAGSNNAKFGRLGAQMQFTGIQTNEGTFTLTNAAGITGSPAGTVRYTQLGNNVAMTLPSLNGAASGASITFSGIPVALRPVRQQICACLVVNNTTDICGFFRVNTDGTATLFANISGAVTTAFSNVGTQGLDISSISYNLT